MFWCPWTWSLWFLTTWTSFSSQHKHPSLWEASSSPVLLTLAVTVPCFKTNLTEVYLMCGKWYLFQVCDLMSFIIWIHPWNNDHNQDGTFPSVQKFLCAPVQPSLCPQPQATIGLCWSRQIRLHSLGCYRSRSHSLAVLSFTQHGFEIRPCGCTCQCFISCNAVEWLICSFCTFIHPLLNIGLFSVFACWRQSVLSSSLHNH